MNSVYGPIIPFIAFVIIVSINWKYRITCEKIVLWCARGKTKTDSIYAKADDNQVSSCPLCVNDG